MAAAAAAASRGSGGKKMRRKKPRKGAEEEEEEEEAAAAGEEEGEEDCGSAGSLALGDDLRSSEGDGANDTTGRDEENGDAAESGAGTSTGWAEAMAKILSKKTPQSRPTILVKNKELEQEKKKEKQERLEKRKQLDKKREWEMMCRVKPDVVQDKEKERNLQRIATRGVVQLFNAVRKHQKNVDDKMKEAGGSMRKRAKLMSSVSKKDFISVLRGIEGGKNEESASGKTSQVKQAKVKSEEGPGWNILRDDFMMGASMKDWDKESDKEDSAEPGSDNGQDNESDSDS